MGGGSNLKADMHISALHGKRGMWSTGLYTGAGFSFSFVVWLLSGKWPTNFEIRQSVLNITSSASQFTIPVFYTLDTQHQI